MKTYEQRTIKPPKGEYKTILVSKPSFSNVSLYENLQNQHLNYPERALSRVSKPELCHIVPEKKVKADSMVFLAPKEFDNYFMNHILSHDNTQSLSSNIGHKMNARPAPENLVTSQLNRNDHTKGSEQSINYQSRYHDQAPAHNHVHHHSRKTLDRVPQTGNFYKNTQAHHNTDTVSQILKEIGENKRDNNPSERYAYNKKESRNRLNFDSDRKNSLNNRNSSISIDKYLHKNDYRHIKDENEQSYADPRRCFQNHFHFKNKNPLHDIYAASSVNLNQSFLLQNAPCKRKINTEQHIDYGSDSTSREQLSPTKFYRDLFNEETRPNRKYIGCEPSVYDHIHNPNELDRQAKDDALRHVYDSDRRSDSKNVQNVLNIPNFQGKNQPQNDNPEENDEVKVIESIDLSNFFILLLEVVMISINCSIELINGLTNSKKKAKISVNNQNSKRTIQLLLPFGYSTRMTADNFVTIKKLVFAFLIFVIINHFRK